MTASAAPNATEQHDRATRGGKFLTFFLEGEEYGLEILKVREIIGILPITRVPRTPDFIRGVVNLRGKVIPVMDLRMKFAMARLSATESCIIVVQVRGIQLGVIVDRVSEVLSIADADIEPSPDFGAGVQTAYLTGVAQAGDRVRLLLDIDRALAPDDVAALDAAQASA